MSGSDRCQFCEQPVSFDELCQECFCCSSCCLSGIHCEQCGQPVKVCQQTLCGGMPETEAQAA